MRAGKGMGGGGVWERNGQTQRQGSKVCGEGDSYTTEWFKVGKYIHLKVEATNSREAILVSYC